MADLPPEIIILIIGMLDIYTLMVMQSSSIWFGTILCDTIKQHVVEAIKSSKISLYADSVINLNRNNFMDNDPILKVSNPSPSTRQPNVYEFIPPPAVQESQLLLHTTYKVTFTIPEPSPPYGLNKETFLTAEVQRTVDTHDT
jgi:hypothetical protein